jgi:hypothetical protein
MAAPVAAQEAGRAPPMAVEAGVPPGQDDKEIAAPEAAKEVGKALPMTLQAGASP